MKRRSFWATVILLLVIAGLLIVGFDAVRVLFLGLSKVTWSSFANMVGIAIIGIIILFFVAASNVSSEEKKKIPYLGISIFLVIMWIVVLVLAETGIASGVAESMAEFKLQHSLLFQRMQNVGILAAVFTAGMLYTNFVYPRVKVETREIVKRIRVNKRYWVLVRDNNQVQDLVSFPADSTNPVADLTPEDFEVKSVDENGDIIPE